MANPVRRLLPRSLDPRQNVGPPVFADLVEDQVGADDEDRTTTAVVEPDGRISPRFKPFRGKVAPPAPSPQYRADPRYAVGLDLHHDTRMRAIANHRAWYNRHSEATNSTNAWLAAQGLFGAEGEDAYAAYARSHASRAAARAAIAATKTAEVQAGERLSEAAAAFLRTGNAPLPSGAELPAARAAIEAAEATAQAMDTACDQALQRWGRTLVRVNWSEVLKGCEQLKGPDAEQATAWLRAKVYPPPGPTDDPLGWL